MGSLADAIIQRHKDLNNPTQAPDGFHVDDMGYWVEDDLENDKARYAEYLLFRIKRRHPCIYLRYGHLYHKHRLLERTPQEILELADSPSAHARGGQAAWIFNRLRETAPELSENQIMVAPGVYWDIDKAELIDTDDTIITMKDEHVGKRFQEELSETAEESN